MKLTGSSLSSKRELIEKSIKESAVDGKITCPVLRKIAEKLEIPYKEAGNAANKLNIKIKNCDLGCF